ncbi:hypothetical protein GCM10010094_53910 [Streptomyces flaveus]|uniref:Uncharacterized protein n=1 Tax=Streptomyces flaveus TaxID=66370 RepID=A0A917VI65_9ACTN|nr:hypothetical protein GCM10010094_53910 [Streptomyces flaveus]
MRGPTGLVSGGAPQARVSHHDGAVCSHMQKVTIEIIQSAGFDVTNVQEDDGIRPMAVHVKGGQYCSSKWLRVIDNSGRGVRLMFSRSCRELQAGLLIRINK